MTIFREVQRFRQWWLWLILIPGPGILSFNTYRQLMLGKQFGKNAPPNTMLFVLWLLIGIGVPVLFYAARLVTEVRADGIYARFIPFHRSFLRFPWNAIKKCEARTYRPIREYGGWGIRIGFSGRAYNVSGNRGLQLELHDGKRILIGSQRTEEFLDAVKARLTAN
jgi:hypothetical protein